MLKRLRIKFICINMGIVLAMLAVIFALVLGFTRQNLIRENTELMQAALGINSRKDERQGFRGEMRDELPEDRPELPDGFRPYILVELNEDGTIRSSEGYASNNEDELCAIVEAAQSENAGSGILSAYNLRYLRDETPLGVRFVFTDMSSETSTMRGLIRTCLIIGSASLVIFFVISVLLARWAVRPVEAAWKQQRQFVSDASHELKTPLTVIMTNAELLQSPDFNSDAAARARFSENILTMARQMRGLVESLLELARVENGAVETASAELDFSALCADAVLPFEPLCFEKGLSVSSDIAEGIRLRGSESHLRQVVEILLDNAQKYADPGSEITIRLLRAGGKCALSVADRGAPISPEDLPHLFERFYRADKARSRDGSYGLGLSIAQKIVEEHHGKIWAESKNGLNTFFVTLPVLP